VLEEELGALSEERLDEELLTLLDRLSAGFKPVFQVRTLKDSEGRIEVVLGGFEFKVVLRKETLLVRSTGLLPPNILMPPALAILDASALEEFELIEDELELEELELDEDELGIDGDEFELEELELDEDELGIDGDEFELEELELDEDEIKLVL
jgi:hypothetical protein